MMHRHAKPLSLGLLLLGGIFFFVGGPSEPVARSVQSAWDMGHVVFFFAATVVWIKWGRRGTVGNSVRGWVVVLASVAVIGLGIEGVQVLIGRSGEFSDLLRNLVGTVLALAFFAPDGGLQVGWARTTVRVVAMVLLIVASVPLLVALADEISASRAFPVLADFETPFQLSRWESDGTLSVERDIVRNGRRALKVPLSTARYSKVNLQFFPGDWSQVSVLLASVYNPHPDPLDLNLRIHDEWHDKHGQRYSDRFNRVFTISSGWSDLMIPIDDIATGPTDRLMDLSKIAGLSFFTVELTEPRTIIIDEVALR